MDKIAIIGMGCLFPEARNPGEFFDLLMQKRDVATPLTSQELGVDPRFYFDSRPGAPDKIGYHKNGYIRGFRFDPHGYELAPEDLEGLDRNYQWPIYVARQALEDSGYWKRSAALTGCGIILGNPAFPTLSSRRIFSWMHHRALEPYLQKLLHRDDFTLADEPPKEMSDVNARTTGLSTRITAQALGLHGPCYEVDAACATSIYAVQLAAYYLRTGQAEMMLAGAVCCPDYLYVANGFQVLRAFPPPGGQSLPFDRHSQGLKIGEGAALLVLKRYGDALRDGDRIHAVIEAIGLSNDGRGKHILMPSSAGQILALERAYRGIDRQPDYIECHATGTPLGDKTELTTLESFFRNSPSLPLLGGNKANIGHTMTVAAMAGIIKVILSMNRGIIPATIDVESPIFSRSGGFKEEHLVRDHRPWPKKDKKIAGVNAFGFGGVNSHMVLAAPHTEGDEKHRYCNAGEPSYEKLAIVGMHGHWGNLDSLEELNDAIYHGKQTFQPLSTERWIGRERNRSLLETFGLGEAGSLLRGSYCDDFELDCLRFKIPPHEADAQLFNHLLMLHTADRALQDAGFSLTGSSRNIAVIIGTKMDWANHLRLTRLELPLHLQRKLHQYGINLSPKQREILETITKDAICPEATLEGTTSGIGNLAASRISAVWNFTGPCLVVSSQENSAYKALELARFLLTFDEEIEAVVLGAIDLAGSFEHVLWHSRRNKAACAERGFAFDAASSGWNIGEGAGALVLKRERDCSEDRIYARIRALKILQQCVSDRLEPAPDPEYVFRACTECFREAGVSPGRPGYLEACAGGIESEDRAELAGLARAYGKTDGPGWTIGSIKANIGHTFAASGIAALIKTALCLYHEYLPAIPGKHSPKYPDITQDAFQILDRSCNWPGPDRMAAINGIGLDGSYVHLILEEPTGDQRKAGQKKIFPAAPDDISNSLVKRLSSGWQPLDTYILQKEHCKHFPPLTSSTAISAAPSPVYRYNEAILWRNAETQFMYSQVKQAFQKNLVSLLEEKPEEFTTSGKGKTPEELPPLDESRLKSELVWDTNQILEMTEGELSAVLGPEYSDIDGYRIRARLPLPPFQFVTRVTRLSAQRGQLKPCTIDWEYDIPRDEWYITADRVPGIVPFESSHALILALSYLGCDRLFRGEWRYRALDSTVTFYGYAPLPGDRITGRANVHSFVKSGRSLLIFYDYDCLVDGRRIFRIRANAGFFSAQDLNGNRERFVRKSEDSGETNLQEISPPLRCPKTSFGKRDIDALQKGDFPSCFGPEYAPQHPGLLSSPPLRMLDRVVSIDRRGGRWGQGEIVGEKDISPDHWVFASHFKNDPVLPGTLLVEGCSQLILFYMFYLGLHVPFSRLKVDVLKGITSTARFRGEIKPESTIVRFRLQIEQIAVTPETYITASADIIHRDRVIGICDHIGLSFHEGSEYRTAATGTSH